MKYVFILCSPLPWDIHPEEDQEWWAGNMIKCIFNIYTVQQYAQPQIIQCSLYLAIFDNLAKIFALCTASLYNVSKLSWWLQLHKLGKAKIKIKLKLKYLPTGLWHVTMLRLSSPMKTEWVLACIIVNILLPTQSKRSFFVCAQSRSWQMKWHCQHKSCFLCQLLW